MAEVVREWFHWLQAEAQAQSQSFLTFDGPGVKFTTPPAELFKFPPSNIPKTLPPPLENPNSVYPFAIPVTLYNAVLSPTVPITFALVYATLITYLNSVNKERKQRPYWISKTLGFKLFVLAHNVFLALYSLWTFVGMFNAMRNSIANPRVEGLAATVDSFCKLNGPRGLGSAATFNETTSTWGLTNRAYRLGSDGLNPDSSDVGRIWNEGLAYYGWIFYLSKFYEVVDTLIIIAKGKKSSFLQTYHHAGAMMCMWAGIRYMSAPIWMFVLVNSFIHFIMYTFYATTTLNIRVPKWMKQTLTSMQIAQFVVGVIYAFGHYFVAYQVPISVPYLFHFGEAVQEVTSSLKADATSALSVATATASADVGSWLKKLALRAAGREGLAENVENRLGQTFGVNATKAVKNYVHRNETRYKDELLWVNCLDTSGQAFAVWLNLFYLLPLTWLFGQFFVKSYMKRVEERRRSSVGQNMYIAGQSIVDARKGVGRRLSEAFEDYQGTTNGDLNSQEGILHGEDITENLRDIFRKSQESGQDVSRDVSKTLNEKSADISRAVNEKTSEVSKVVKEKASGISQSASEKASSVSKTVNQKASNASKAANEKSSNVSKNGEPKTPSTPKSNKESSSMSSSFSSDEQYQQMYEEMKMEAQSASKKAKEYIESVGPSQQTQENFKNKVSDAATSAKKSVESLVSEDTTSNAADTAEKVKEEAEKLATKAERKVEEVGKEVIDKGKEAKDSGKEAKDSGKEAKDSSKEAKKNVVKNVEETTDKIEQKGSDTGSKQAGQAKSAKTGSSTQAQASKIPTKAGQTKSDPKVKQGKSFADAAAEGVPEEEKGEVKVVDAQEDDNTSGKEVEEGA